MHGQIKHASKTCQGKQSFSDTFPNVGMHNIQPAGTPRQPAFQPSHHPRFGNNWPTMNINHESRRICTQIESKYCLSDSENSSASGAVSTDPIFGTPVPLGGHQMLCPWNPSVISIHRLSDLVLRPLKIQNADLRTHKLGVSIRACLLTVLICVQLRNSQCSRRGEWVSE